MLVFRFSMMIALAVLLIYTAVVISNHGLNLFQTFFGDIARMEWAGQFNLDFMCMLALSAAWVAWRHRFSSVGLLLGVTAFLGGFVFLAVYLVVQLQRCSGDVVEVLVGQRR